MKPNVTSSSALLSNATITAGRAPLGVMTNDVLTLPYMVSCAVQGLPVSKVESTISSDTVIAIGSNALVSKVGSTALLNP